MAYRIAVASSDGKVINQHFGRAKKFLIFDIGDSSSAFVELRENVPACQGFEHSDKDMEKSIEIIADCKAVFVSRIGYGALAALQSKGIRAFEAPYLIQDVLEKIQSSALQI